VRGIDFYGGDLKVFECDSESAAHLVAQKALAELNKDNFCVQYSPEEKKAYLKNILDTSPCTMGSMKTYLIGRSTEKENLFAINGIEFK
jgi:hypothetical protein